MVDKPILWLGDSLDKSSNFPPAAKRKAGFQLRALQRGLVPSDFKPMQTVGKGVQEIRVSVGGAFRVFYVARFEEAVYVLHAFQKKAQKTNQQDIDMEKKRYEEMLEVRRFGDELPADQDSQ